MPWTAKHGCMPAAPASTTKRERHAATLGCLRRTNLSGKQEPQIREQMYLHSDF